MGRKQTLIRKNVSKSKKLLQHDKASMKVIHEYNKLKRTEGFANRKGFFDDDNAAAEEKPQQKIKKMFKPTNKILLAQRAGEEKKRKAQEKQEEAMRRIDERNRKLRERAEKRKKLNAKTAKGQPVMCNQIEHLLEKIEKNPGLYSK